MAEDAKGKHDYRIVVALVALLLLFWGLFAFLPLIVLRSTYFSLETPAAVERVQAVLGLLGTYGDMFGALNCLFSGTAMIGVVYAVILQRRELHHQQEEIVKGRTDREAAAAWQRRTALLQATSFLAQSQASRLASLQVMENSDLSPEATVALIEQGVEVTAQLMRNINILSNFVTILVLEHEQDVQDPQALRAAFGLAPREEKTT
jgi:hypothetical protein